MYKMEQAFKNGYSMIRIKQEDVFKDKYNWQEELEKNINLIVNSNKVQNIFMAKDDTYRNHKMHMFLFELKQLSITN
jgi:hypothetical protein